MLEFTLLTEKEIPFIHNLEKELFTDPWSEKSLLSWLSLSGSAGYLLKTEGEPLAYALFQTVAGEGELLRCGVLKEKMRQGLGFSLLSFALREEKIKHTQRIFLEVRSQNLPAKNLYEKLGFSLAGCRKNYYQKPLDDALIYEKIL